MKLVDLTKCSWGTTYNGGTSYGCCYKTSLVEGGKKYYYKFSNSVDG